MSRDKIFDFLHSDEMGNAGDQIAEVARGIGKLLFGETDIVTGARLEEDGKTITVAAPPSAFAECIHGESCAGHRGDRPCNVFSATESPTVPQGRKTAPPAAPSPPAPAAGFCEECGAPRTRATAKFCARCGESFGL